MVRRAATLLTSPRLIWAVDSFRALWNSWSCSSARTSRRSRYFGDLSLFMGITILGYEYSLINDRRPARSPQAGSPEARSQRPTSRPTRPVSPGNRPKEEAQVCGRVEPAHGRHQVLARRTGADPHGE